MINMWIINHSSLPPELGGLNRHYYFTRHLSQMGYDIKIITSSAIHNTDINIIGKADRNTVVDKEFGGVVFTYLKTSGYKGNGLLRIINLMQFPLRLLRKYKRMGRPDIIYASSPYPLSALAAIYIARKLNVPAILEVRDLWPLTIVVLKKISSKNPLIRIMFGLEKWMYKNADRIIFTFEGGKDYIEDKGWSDVIDVKKAEHINNGIDMQEFAEDANLPVTDTDVLEPDTFKVGYAGSIRLAYGLEQLVDAARILQQTYKNIGFFIWGDGNYKQELMAKCEQQQIHNVTFKGRVPRKRIPSLLSKMDVNIILLDSSCDGTLTRYGSSHNKLFDYLASGRPIITNYQSRYNLLTRYNCGIVAERPDAEGLAKAITDVFEMTLVEYQRLSENARKAARVYDYRELSKKLHSVVTDVLDSSKQRT